MKKHLLIILLGFLLSNVAFAEPVVLKCITNTGQKVADLTIDLRMKKMKWGTVSEYDIVNVTDTYISAYEKPNGVGGEICVINRITGLYKRSTVGIYYSSARPKPGDEGSFEAIIYSGRCSKQQF